MAKEKGRHLSFDDRCDIEEMIKEGRSFRAIAASIGASPTTVSNEVRANRTFSGPRPLSGKAQSRCSRYGDCRVVGLCHVRSSGAASCKRCRKKHCCDLCGDFSQITCPDLDRAPFVCTPCAKRSWCVWGKARYIASKAQAKRDERLSLAHAGVACDLADLRMMAAKAGKLLSQGQSLEAVWAVHGGEFPVCMRTSCSYMDRGVMGLANIELPRKASCAPRRKRERGGPKMDLAGRTYADWLAPGDASKLPAVQIDCVEGSRRSTKRVLTLRFARLLFQLFVLLPAKTQACVKGALDALEAYCEGAFADAFPVILGGRGSEFLDFSKIETGVGGNKRTRMLCCDPLKPGQKGAFEKNHVELRKVIPKGTDLDRLTAWDVAVARGHASSYARAGRGVAPIALASAALPANLPEGLGICAVPPDDVVMRPSLLGLQREDCKPRRAGEEP